MQVFEIKDKDCNLSLRDFLKSTNPLLSNKKLKSLIDSGFALVNHRIERFYSRRLIEGDLVEFKSQVFDQKLKVLYSDEDYIVVDKPINFVCTQKAFRLALHQKLFLVHRLDKGTSGVMVLAKNERMKVHLEKLFFKREVKKTYWALTAPFDCVGEICINKPLEIQQDGNKKVVSVCEGGQSAKTYVKVLASTKSASLVSARPITGKTHQIRVHLQSIGSSILGDLEYQSFNQKHQIFPSLMLHAKTLSFMDLNLKFKTFESIPNHLFIEEMIRSNINYSSAI